MKIEITLKTKNIVSNIIAGIFWFLAGVFYIWDDNLIFMCLGTAMITASLICLLYAKYTHVEKGDEMSEYNYTKARSSTYGIILIGFLVLALITVIIKMIFGFELASSWKPLLYMFIGIMQFVCGLYFISYEKGGDRCQD